MNKKIQIFPKDKKQRQALTQWLLENNIHFEEIDSTYDAATIEKILAAKQNIEDGNFVKYSPDLLWK